MIKHINNFKVEGWEDEKTDSQNRKFMVLILAYVYEPDDFGNMNPTEYFRVKITSYKLFDIIKKLKYGDTVKAEIDVRGYKFINAQTGVTQYTPLILLVNIMKL